MLKRAQHIRVLYCEIGRILNHLLNLTTFAIDAGAMTPLLWGFEERETLMEFYDGPQVRVCVPISVRAVASGPADGLTDDILAWADKFPNFIADLETLLTNNRIFKQRTVDIGVLSTEEALDLGMSGPVLRATGHAWDLRKAQLMNVMPRCILHGRHHRGLLCPVSGAD